MNVEDLEQRVASIEKRNVLVEADKKWETSLTRKVSIAILTYFVICLFLYTINESDIFLKALVPVVGFVLSTASLRIIRNIVR